MVEKFEIEKKDLMPLDQNIKVYNLDFQEKFFQFCEKMWTQLGRPWDPSKFQIDLLDIPKNYQINGGNFWLVFDEENVVGCTGLKPLSVDTIELVRFYVLLENRGKKIGAELLHKALHHALQENFKNIVLDTDSNKSIRAIDIFSRVGFKKIPPYKETLFSDTFMELDLRNYNCPFCKE